MRQTEPTKETPPRYAEFLLLQLSPHKANEYLDEKDVLEQKMEIVANLIRSSKFCCAYTGAGLSSSSGIPDYATKAKDTIIKVCMQGSLW